MKEVVITDKHNNSFTVFELNGRLQMPTYWYPNGKEFEMVDFPSDEQFFEDDILLLSYPRSGYTWTWECLNMLTHNTSKISDLTVVDTNIEGTVILKSRKCLEQKRPRIFHTHWPIQLIPQKLLKMKMIFLYRNPKDMVYSWYRLLKESTVPPYEGTFEDFVELFLEGRVPYGSWFEYMLESEKYIEENNICVSQYEERAKDPVANLKRIAQYVGVDVTEDFIKKVSDATNINIMIHEKPQHGILKQEYDEETLKRKGKVGGWKEHFSVALNEKFDIVFQERMKHSKLKFTFTL